MPNIIHPFFFAGSISIGADQLFLGRLLTEFTWF